MLEPTRVIELFMTSPHIHEVKAGEVIFEVDTLGEVMYGVIEGEVEMRVKGHTVETIRHGDIFGEGALVQIPPVRASTAVAKTDCKLAAVDRTHFMFLVQETPLFALEVIRSLSTRLRHFKALV
ncbi:MAG: cyclic nucleotide-binding domain-containing protein [Leptolyngbya sp. DLM2.Bin27]|nr:MAG: cyclic nucleotide-binding domain-containing protein [Leptolyngbya sp. DLM2.Bin27]